MSNLALPETFKVTRDADGELILNDPDICLSLQLLLDEGCLILLDTNAVGSYRVRISYGSLERDQKIKDGFDEAEWGTDTKLLRAFRYALGQAYGSESIQ